MRRSHLFAKRSNSKTSDLHMLAKVFRVNSRFRFTFLDSRRFHTLFQFANAVKSISPSIDLTVDSHRSSRESKTMKYSWRSLSWKSIDLKKSQKLLFSNFSLVTLLSWRSHYFEKILNRVNLFCFYFLRSLCHSFEKDLSLRKFNMLFLLFARLLRSFTVCFVLLWGSHWFERVKSLLFCWFVRIWLFFFVVASSWFSTITHLLFTLCDSLSNDKYEREKNRKYDQTWQYSFEKTYCAIKKKTKCVTISFRKAYCINTATMNLLQWCTASWSIQSMIRVEIR